MENKTVNFNDFDDCDSINQYLKTLDKTDTKVYAKSLSELFNWCEEMDPVLIEEFWADHVLDFLAFLKSDQCI